MKKSIKIVLLAAIGVFLAVIIACNVLGGIYANQITAFLCGTGENFEGEDVKQALAASDALCREIGEDSMVLLKNENDTLPLSETEKAINVFGFGASDKGFLLRGVGSGSSTISSKVDSDGKPKKKTLLTALTEGGFAYNKDVMKIYDGFTAGVRPETPGSGNVYNLAEPPLSAFDDDLMTKAAAFSDVALFVISRDGGENVGEIPTQQAGNKNKTYLDITDAEENMLDLLGRNFGKVIVLLNTTNTMHTGFLSDANIGAALYVGLTGQSAAMAIPKLLSGDVSPSGKTTDIGVYSPDYDPTFANREQISNSIQYQEGIYYGYKWYETADKEGFFSDVDNDYGQGYDGVVQYPFGYGLSYTEFTWTVVDVSLPSGGNLTEKTEITVTVNVENTGGKPGKDVVELYYTPQYNDGEVEKAEINLLDFAKTSLLEPGKAQNVTLSFRAYDLASYDCYDKNDNDYATYELDEGDYTIKLMTDSHNPAKCEKNAMTYRAAADIVFEEDPVTGETVENRFTGSSAYAGVPVDGSTVGAATTYMTRSDFKGTFPSVHAKTPNNNSLIDKAAFFMNDVYDTDVMHKTTPGSRRIVRLKGGAAATYEQLTGKGGNVEFEYNTELMATLAAEYDSQDWNDLLNQLTVGELKNLAELGGFRTLAVESVGKPLCTDYDGPAGFNTNSLSGDWGGKSPDTDSWTAFPSEALIGCAWNKELLRKMGLSMGAEAAATKCNGWYAPGVNLHRSAYTARNFEYYSEDAALSGKLAAQLIYGAKINGLYCYIKHFACSEPGPNPRELNTWLTEQNLRENYLRPFEIAVKEGGANALMTAFNRVGATWAGANYAMNVQVLRNEWGFNGSVITDWTTGGGLGGMNARQGVRAGNDLWLNPGNSLKDGGGLDTSDATDMACAKQAVHNILYTYVDTYEFYRTFDRESIDDMFDVKIGVNFKEDVFRWWIVLLAGIDVLAVGGAAVGIFFMVVKPKIKKRKENS